MEVIRSLLNACSNKKKINKRSLFYDHRHIASSQKMTDGIIEDITCMLRCARASLPVYASEKGLVLGNLKFKEDGNAIDCTKFGMPDVASRLFLRKLKFKLNLPVLALMDCDKSGIEIMSVYRYGSKSMAYDSANLITLQISSGWELGHLT
ncbi:Spo11/DNA topoisomerase VI subunit A [Trema orientale]|uniref:DNA topoisomerase (ATP-hydrolyzing) n=1 Tax=Trema orientale TaxID=63057 RepID=A0A2P5BSP7_TREOI|nr:Spo11/DNA topoisomerase VI subunit A [Trema orientale]